MGQSLGMETIAEGVETREQIEFLRRHRCRNVQGYYITRPLPPEEVERFFWGAWHFDSAG